MGFQERVDQGVVIARVADGEADRELREHAGLENFFDFAHGAVDVQLFAVARDDAGGFLAAMLQRIQPEICEVRRFGMAEDAEDTTLVVEVIVGESEFLTHFEVNLRSSEWAQTPPSSSPQPPITPPPL